MWSDSNSEMLMIFKGLIDRRYLVSERKSQLYYFWFQFFLVGKIKVESR